MMWPGGDRRCVVPATKAAKGLLYRVATRCRLGGIRDILLPKLLSGEPRLSETEKQVAEVV